MRRYYIDNIRSLGILLLFPFHACMVYNGFESFYVHGSVVRICNDFILLVGIWFMPLLFLLAGMSSYLALQKRTWKEYLKERLLKLLIPLIFGVLLVVPNQTYYAEKFHNSYQGGYFEQYILFFTKLTDLTGYSGGFTPAHLWFLLYLFIISVFALPIMIKLKSLEIIKIDWFKDPINIMLLFIIPLFSSIILDIGGKSLGQFLSLVLIGFLMCKEDEVLNILEKYRLLYFILSLILSIVFYNIYYTIGWQSGFSLLSIAFSALRHFIMWTSILTILGYGKRYFNYTNKVMTYFSKASFPVYIFHQTWIVAITYYIFKITDIIIVQFISIMSLSFIMSILTYEIFRRIFITRFMFGIKK